MNRGEAAKVAAGLLASAAVPAWIREAFGDAPAQAPEAIRAARDARRKARLAERERAAAISNAYKRAKEVGKPLLVFFIPADRPLRYERGLAFGQFLSQSPNEWLADLALCDVVCREAKELAPIAPKVLPPEPLMLMIETWGRSPELKRIDGKIPPEDRSGILGYAVCDKATDAEQQRREADERRRRYEASVAS